MPFRTRPHSCTRTALSRTGIRPAVGYQTLRRPPATISQLQTKGAPSPPSVHMVLATPRSEELRGPWLFLGVGVRLLMSRGRRWSRWWRCSSGRARSGAAARLAGCAHSTARRHLVRVGLVAAEPMPLGKPDERARFESTDPTSWNTSPKNSTPDHERRSTGQPQPSVFVIYSRRPEPLGKTHRCCEHPVNPPTGDGAPFAIDRE